jgi:hypothetical protein
VVLFFFLLPSMAPESQEDFDLQSSRCLPLHPSHHFVPSLKFHTFQPIGLAPAKQMQKVLLAGKMVSNKMGMNYFNNMCCLSICTEM